MDTESLKKFREAFTRQHLDPPSAHAGNFDARDVTRIKQDDKYAQRFLLWKKGNIENAVKAAVDVLEWRKKNNLMDLAPEDLSCEFYKRESMFVHGKDIDGNRIVTFIGRRFEKDQEADAKKLFMYLLERLQREEPECRITFVLDAGECGMNNVDLGLIRLIVDSFMHYFPALLERTLVVDLPGILSAIWNMVKVWFDEEVRNRTQQCSRKDLGQYISDDQLLTILGGKDSWGVSDLKQDMNCELQKGDDQFVDALENFSLHEA